MIGSEWSICRDPDDTVVGFATVKFLIVTDTVNVGGFLTL